MSALDFFKDQEIRSEIYDAIQGVLNRYDLLITPTLACLPVDNADDGNTMGPTTINGEEVDPLIGWCLTYFIDFSGHPAASIPAGMADDDLPVGMQIIGGATPTRTCSRRARPSSVCGLAGTYGFAPRGPFKRVASERPQPHRRRSTYRRR